MHQASSSRPNAQGDRIVWVTTSWDDGYPLDLRVAGLLDRYGVPGTFYVPLRSQMPVICNEQIRELATRFEIGGHTVNHVLLDQVSGQCARAEIIESKRRLEDITGTACNVFCPPAGRYARSHLHDIRRAGFIGLRTVELMSASYPRPRDGLVILTPTVQLYRHGVSTYLKNALKRRRWRNIQTYFHHAHGRDLVHATTALLESLVNTGGVLHLWGHSWELEHSRLWGALENILKQLWAFRDRCRFVSNAELCQRFAPAASISFEKAMPRRARNSAICYR